MPSGVWRCKLTSRKVGRVISFGIADRTSLNEAAGRNVLLRFVSSTLEKSVKSMQLMSLMPRMEKKIVALFFPPVNKGCKRERYFFANSPGFPFSLKIGD